MRPDNQERTNRTLLEGVTKGDTAAFKQLYHRFYHRVLRFIMRITRRVDTAEEGVNDVMLVVWRQAGAFEGRSTVATWIMGIAYRTALKLASNTARMNERFVSAESMGGDELSGPQPAPIDTEVEQQWLDAGLEQLSTEHRAVVELTYFHGYSYKEIAAIMDCPVNTVKTRMFHARANLREALPALGGIAAPRAAGEQQ